MLNKLINPDFRVELFTPKNSNYHKRAFHIQYIDGSFHTAFGNIQDCFKEIKEMICNTTELPKQLHVQIFEEDGSIIWNNNLELLDKVLEKQKTRRQ